MTMNPKDTKVGTKRIVASYRFLLSLCSLCLWGSIVFAAATSPLPKERKETRYGISFLGQRIGTSTIVEAPVTFRGKRALKVESRSRIRIAALGEVEQNVDLTQYLDEKWAPLHLDFRMLSGGATTRVLAEFLPDRVECEVSSGETKSKKTVPIPKGASLVADPQMLGGRTLQVGQKQQLHLFEPLTLQVLPMDVEVLRKEKLTLEGKTYAALVVRTVNGVTGASTNWLTEEGELLKGVTEALGIEMVREAGGARPPGAPEKTPAITKYEPPVDLAIATAIRTKKKIESPRTVNSLRARIGGIPEPRLVLSDARQRATIQGKADGKGGLTALYEVRADADGALPADDPGYRKRKPANGEGGGSAARGAGVTPDRQGDGATARTYLEDAPYLNLDDERIRAKAKEIVGDETDPGKKAEKIRAWVHATMTSDTSIGVPRASVDVLGRPRGVCRDYAVLFAALARAAGVPTRIVAGIVYFKDGFYYHAWNECRTGEDAWRAFDATLPTDFVDATHVKFAQGDPTEMFQAVRVVGRLKVEILEYR
jgi:hypothetical protein